MNKVAFENHDDGTFEVIPYVDFDFSNLDTIDDEAREIIAAEGDLTAFMAAWVESKANRLRWESVLGILIAIIDAQKPKLTARQIAYASGALIGHKMTMASIAKDHGVTKQAFQQGVERLTAELNIKPLYGARSDKARESMQRAYLKTCKI